MTPIPVLVFFKVEVRLIYLIVMHGVLLELQPFEDIVIILSLLIIILECLGFSSKKSTRASLTMQYLFKK